MASELLSQIQEYNEAYYNGEPLVTDEEYDRLVADYTGLTGNTPLTGVLPSQEKVRVTLPVYMGGTNKYKYSDDPGILRRFMAGNTSFLVSEKLDGTAAVVEIPPRGSIRAFTRGDYTTGFEITEILKAISSPLWRRFDTTVYVRGELIIPKAVFREKYASDFTNSRSLVNGIVNAKNRDPEVLKDIHFVAFEILSTPRGTFEQQLAEIFSHGISVVNHTFLTAEDLTAESLQQTYTEFSETSRYTLDGLVVYKNDASHSICMDRNPSFSIAYKPPTVSVTVTVAEIEWTVSRYNKLKPVAIFPPVTLAGTTVTHATAHNGRFVMMNLLGPGAVIEITKSNEVIPYIVSVVEPCDSHATPTVPFEWCSNQVDYMLTGVDTTVLVKQIVHFLKSCGVKGISEKTVEKLVDTGVESILDFLTVPDSVLYELPGFKAKKVEGFRKSLSVLNSGVELADIMAGSPVFPHGFGKRKFAAITAEIPEILELVEQADFPENLKFRLCGTHGISEKSANLICDRLPAFARFVSAATDRGVLSVALPRAPVETRESVEDFGTVVFSGFRDPALQNLIEERGGTVAGNVTKKTRFVLVKDLSKETTKTRRANELNIPVLLKADFMVE